MDEFSNAIAAAKSQSENLRAITEDRNAIIFFGDQGGNIHVVHSPTNFGGTRSCPANKVACLIGMGPLVTAVVLNAEQAIATPKFRAPLAAKLHECTIAEQFRALVPPGS